MSPRASARAPNATVALLANRQIVPTMGMWSTSFGYGPWRLFPV